ncbi:MAG: hypothetical protein HYY16_08380 [Planctomycetes bacterium]|nr:hypothetical protein [Planctomycetota bacterium]
MMDFEKLAKDVEKLEKSSGAVGAAAAKKPEQIDAKDVAEAVRTFMLTARDAVTMFLKDRKEQIRAGHLFQDAAAKQIIPTEAAVRADGLLIRWGGHVTPTDARAVHEDAVKVTALAGKLVPVLKAYQKPNP